MDMKDTQTIDRRGLTVFLHIPKTAGTTLNSIFAHHLSEGERYKLMMRGMSFVRPRFCLLPPRLISRSNLRRFREALARPGQLKIVDGHFDMSIASHMPADACWVTLLRDPVARAISHHQHYRKLSADPVHRLAQESSLVDWVATRGLVEMDNGQTRRLAGEMGRPIGRVDASVLAKAKANLTRFHLVGLSERFEEFQVLLNAAMAWPCLRYPAQNVGQRSSTHRLLSASERSLIESLNAFDVELYHFANSLFENSIRHLDMSAELMRLRAAPESACKSSCLL